jgi:hypothetical protein
MNQVEPYLGVRGVTVAKITAGKGFECCGLRFEHTLLNSAISETFLSKSLLNIGKC